MKQITLFDFLEEPASTPAHTKEDNSQSDEWALVYLVTFGSGFKGNLFVLKRDDAIKLCQDDCSHGIGRGGEWMFCWTSLGHFLKDDDAASQHKNVHGNLEDFVFLLDTGKQDADFERLGIIKPTLAESKAILQRMGYNLKIK